MARSVRAASRRLPREGDADGLLKPEHLRRKWVYGYGEMLDTFDGAFGVAAGVAAATVEANRAGFPLERDLERALLPPLQQALEDCVIEARRPLDIPSWDPQPGAVDVVALKGENALVAAELKIASVEHVLWDLLKLLCVEPPLSAGYLLVAASARKFGSGGAYTPLFESSDMKQWSSVELITRWPKAFADLLEGGPGRPRKVPAVAESKLIAAEPMKLVASYELRVLHVRRGSDDWTEVPYA
jgi:hypothetical protein